MRERYAREGREDERRESREGRKRVFEMERKDECVRETKGGGMKEGEQERGGRRREYKMGEGGGI
jgi:hypothetical protein